MSKPDNPIQAKSYVFAVRIVKLCQLLATEKREFVLWNKNRRKRGGSHRRPIEAGLPLENFNRLQRGQRNHDWLRLLRDTDYLTPPQFDLIHAAAGATSFRV